MKQLSLLLFSSALFTSLLIFFLLHCFALFTSLLLYFCSLLPPFLSSTIFLMWFNSCSVYQYAMLCHAVIYCTEHYCASSSQSYITWCVVPPLEFQSLYSIQFNSIQFNSIQFNSILFCSVLFWLHIICPFLLHIDPCPIFTWPAFYPYYLALLFCFVHCIDLFCSILLCYIIPFYSLILCDALYWSLLFYSTLLHHSFFFSHTLRCTVLIKSVLFYYTIPSSSVPSHLFFTEFSVRPGSTLEISHHLPDRNHI